MSYDSHAAGADAGQHGFRRPFAPEGDMFGWAKTPGFNPLKLVAVVGGLAIFPPLGLAALAYFIWNGRRAWRHGEGRHGEGWHGSGRHCGRGRMGRTGNAAFDEHRAKVMEDLDAEREAFFAHRAEQRRQRDEAAFEAFKAERAKAQAVKK